MLQLVLKITHQWFLITVHVPDSDLHRKPVKP